MEAPVDHLETTDALTPGRTIGAKYTVLQHLGIGGMGSVYEALTTWGGQRVAVKILRGSLAHNAEVVERFLLEAQATRRVAHPHVVEVLDVGEDAALGTYFIVQEFLDGMDLARWVERRGAIPAQEAVALVTPIMSALAAAHDAGIVHRDIKPENVFLAVGPHGEMIPKLIDFGVSKVRDGGLRGPTRAGLAIGTPDYMSPEQARGDADVDARSDVWSMGVMLYQLLTGRTPYEAATETLLLVAIITERPIPIERFVSNLPKGLVAIVHRALTHDRAQRFQTMRDFLGALENCVLDDEVHDISSSTTSASLPAAPQVLAIAPRLAPPSPAVAPMAPPMVPPVMLSEAHATPMQWAPPPSPSPPVAPRRGPPRGVLAVVGLAVVALTVVGFALRRGVPETPRELRSVITDDVPGGDLVVDAGTFVADAHLVSVPGTPQGSTEDAAVPVTADVPPFAIDPTPVQAIVDAGEPAALVDAGEPVRDEVVRPVVNRVGRRRPWVRPRNNAPILLP